MLLLQRHAAAAGVIGASADEVDVVKGVGGCVAG